MFDDSTGISASNPPRGASAVKHEEQDGVYVMERRRLVYGCILMYRVPRDEGVSQCIKHTLLIHLLVEQTKTGRAKRETIKL